MLTISAEQIDHCLTHEGLVETLRAAFRAGAVQPVRHHHTIERAKGSVSTLLLMPAWSDFSAEEGDGHIGVKVVTVSPDNNAIGKPAVMGIYLLMDGKTGEPQALIDGQRLTLWRTACASALAASYLAREDASRLLVIGAGALAPHLVRAHRSQRPIRAVKIWNRTPDNARRVAETLRGEGLEAEVTQDLDAAVSWAHIVTSATLSTEPLVRGAALSPGTHVDLVGAFTPDMRESDDAALSRASVFVDTLAGATKEAGDIVQGLRSGALTQADIKADLYALTRGEKPGRQSGEEITLFKSVGAAIEDLAAGIAVYRALAG
ncbi:ornithine cyclodeaminase family protein [Chelativorans intermedius]|uniref:Ornithine cyclodeaminase family protein n=1 Tax=Chelativorans intermedius TaxID=515947 RepID=A0ABV6DDB7_9HYPH|nr:ornithine cyclodeaminase family protein [Chelativorans intermedius]MCT8999103.1 ornithine cyclodeaminase family protein [Chelativorans intermedius]